MSNRFIPSSSVNSKSPWSKSKEGSVIALCAHEPNTDQNFFSLRRMTTQLKVFHWKESASKIFLISESFDNRSKKNVVPVVKKIGRTSERFVGISIIFKPILPEINFDLANSIKRVLRFNFFPFLFQRFIFLFRDSGFLVWKKFIGVYCIPPILINERLLSGTSMRPKSLA